MRVTISIGQYVVAAVMLTLGWTAVDPKTASSLTTLGLVVLAGALVEDSWTTWKDTRRERQLKSDCDVTQVVMQVKDKR